MSSEGSQNITLEPNKAALTPLFIFLLPILCFFVGHLIHKFHLYWLPESVGTMFGMCLVSSLCSVPLLSSPRFSLFLLLSSSLDCSVIFVLFMTCFIVNGSIIHNLISYISSLHYASTCHLFLIFLISYLMSHVPYNLRLFLYV